MTPKAATEVSKGIMTSVSEHGLLVTFAGIVFVIMLIAGYWMFRFLFHEEKGVVRQLLNMHKEHLADMKSSMQKIADNGENTAILMKDTLKKADRQEVKIEEQFEETHKKLDRVLSDTQSIQVGLAGLRA